MPVDRSSPDAPPSDPLGALALAEWGHHVECILRGIAHTLNNRAAALSAVVELLREPEQDAGATVAILSTELESIGALAAAVGLIGSPRHGMEAFAPSDAAAEALSVLKLHSEQRDPPVTIDSQNVPAVRVPRWMFVRALIALGAKASTMVVCEDGEWIAVRATGLTGDSPPTLVVELARRMGGEPLTGAQRGFRVPSLAAIRQREGR